MDAVLTASSLLELELFAGLSPAEIAGFEGRLPVETHRRGTYLFRRGDAGEALYVVLDGQVALELPSGEGTRVLGLSGPGDWFGELALLTHGPRTADARIAVDATLLRIARDTWAELSRRAPGLFARLCERLGSHLRARNEPVGTARRTVIACLEPSSGEASWVPVLADSLRRQFPRRNVSALAADGTPITAADAGCVRTARPALDRALARLVAADALILVRDVRDVADRSLVRVDRTEWTIEPGRGGRDVDRIRGTSVGEALDRVARHVAGGTVGVALGAGGAFGFSHLGALEVLETAGIPVDFVAGASMGAVLGGLYAAGVTPVRAMDVAYDLASHYRAVVLRDLDLRGATLLKGEGVMKILAEFGEARDATFESLPIPFAAIAMDLATGEEVALESGPLLDGIRPSFAMPGIFPPCVVGERLLIDGAMVNPVPVDRVRALGADFVIASQPIPGLSSDAADPLGAFLDRAQRFVEKIPVRRLGERLRTLNVSIRSFQSLWYRLATGAARRADAAITPDVGEFWFLQFAQAPRIIDAGRDAALAAVPAIREMLRDRVGLGLP